MKRIGYVASKMAKGSLWSYNAFVVLISSLCSFIVFLVAVFFVVAALFFIFFMFRFFLPDASPQAGFNIGMICVSAIAVLTGLLNAVAIAKNLKFTKKKI